MMKRRFIILLLVASVLTTTNASDLFHEPGLLQSPNVATLGSLRQPDVSLFTGTPSVSVPLYDIVLPTMSIPIELRYSGTSIQVDQLPSWVGLGWNLSVGGVIARKINDGPDDITYDAAHFGNAQLNYTDGFYRLYNVLNTENWWRFEINNSGLMSDYAYYDSEPDEFYFNFLDYTGRFYINHRGKLEVQCNKSVSISLINSMIEPPFAVSDKGWSDMTRQPNCFAGFIIKTEDGTQFVFGNDTSAIDFCTPLFDQQQTMVATAWHLTKIVTAGKQEVDFKYTRKKFTYELYDVSQQLISSVVYDFGPFNLAEGATSSESSTSGKLLSPVYLQEISTPSIKVSFFCSEAHDLQYTDDDFLHRYEEMNDDLLLMPYITGFTKHLDYEAKLTAIRNNTAHYKLDRIKVQTIDNSSSRNIYLDYTVNENVRLALNGVRYQDGTQYSFSYNRINDLPPYLSSKSDHWGFYNNRNYANVRINSSSYYSFREPNTAYIQYGLLTDIKYPTGGVSHFEYEPNDYRFQVQEHRWRALEQYNVNKIGGGVRIKSICFYDNEGDTYPSSQRDFFYRKEYINNSASAISTGILGARFKYYYDKRYSLADAEYHTYLYTTGNVLPFCSDENAVCYSEVTEKISDGGYKVYKFTNYSDYLDEAPIYVLNEEDSIFAQCTSMRHMRGLLKEVSDYNSNKTLVHKTSYSYTANKDVSKYVRALNYQLVYLTASQSYYLHIGNSYKFYTHTMVPDSIRDYKISNGTIYDEILTINAYNQNTQMLTQKQVNVNNDVYITRFVYPFNLINNNLYNGINNLPNTNSIAFGMNFEHVYLPWEEISIKNGRVVGAKFYDYARSSTGVYSLSAVYSLGITDPILLFRIVDENKQHDVHYLSIPDISCRYGLNGNITEVTEKGVTTSYIWGYNNTLIIAKVVGGALSQLSEIDKQRYLSYSTMQPTASEISVLHTNLMASFPNALCYTYSYNPLNGITAETLPNGRTQYYSYDNMGRLQEIYMLNGATKSILKKYFYHYSER